ncbi:MAG: hypothetical protein K6B38_14455 [Ruminococcus sp.]|nr:hypothetical protein [Ruminococcus sp.]
MRSLKGKYPEILTNERVKTMYAIMNNAMSAFFIDNNCQQSSYFFQQEDNSSVLLHARRKSACSFALEG